MGIDIGKSKALRGRAIKGTMKKAVGSPVGTFHQNDGRVYRVKLGPIRPAGANKAPNPSVQAAAEAKRDRKNLRRIEDSNIRMVTTIPF